MNIWGKVIGGAAGFAIGGPIGALLGTVAGHAIDTKILPSYISSDQNYKSIVFTAGVIALSAKMAKADGKVTKEEILTFRKLVQIPKDDINQVSKLWELAKETTDGQPPPIFCIIRRNARPMVALGRQPGPRQPKPSFIPI